MFFVFGFQADGCSSNPEALRQNQIKQETTEALLKKQPNPQLGHSMDRDLLIKRLVRFNNPNQMNYLYIFTPSKNLELTIVGKVASTSKRLTDPEGWVTFNSNTYRIPIADEMGTWGSSDPAKVAMTTMGSLIEFGGGMFFYIYSETQLNIGNEQLTKITVQLDDQEKARMAKELAELQNKYNNSNK
jgi:hypothetical protein